MIAKSIEAKELFGIRTMAKQTLYAIDFALRLILFVYPGQRVGSNLNAIKSLFATRVSLPLDERVFSRAIFRYK